VKTRYQRVQETLFAFILSRAPRGAEQEMAERIVDLEDEVRGLLAGQSQSTSAPVVAG
jgi:hypothetical protein